MWSKKYQIEIEIRQDKSQPQSYSWRDENGAGLAELIEAGHSQAGQLRRYLCSAWGVQHKHGCPQHKVESTAENERPQVASATWKAGSWQTDGQQGSVGFPKPDLTIRPVSSGMQPDICKHKYEQRTKDNWTAFKIQYYQNKRKTALNYKETTLENMYKRANKRL